MSNINEFTKKEFTFILNNDTIKKKEGIYLKLIEYPKCSTCKKAKDWLLKNNITFIEQNIKENPPTKEELKYYQTLTEKPLNKFFNTTGLKYKELNLKDKIKDMSEEEKLTLLSQNGMLIKRPLLIGDNFLLIGFNEKEYEKFIKKEG